MRTYHIVEKEESCVVLAPINMGSNETMQEELEERDENNTKKVPELKEMEIFIASDEMSDISDEKDAVEEHEELADSDVKQESLINDEEMVDVCTNEDDSLVNNNNNNNNTTEVAQEKEIEPISGEFSDIYTKEGLSGDDSLVNNNNNTAVTQEEVTEPFSGVFCDSGVRELIESDPFLRQVVDTFLKYHDEMESDMQNGNVCANGGSTPSDVKRH